MNIKIITITIIVLIIVLVGVAWLLSPDGKASVYVYSPNNSDASLQ